MTKLSQSWKEIRERGRKIAANSVVKIEATTGREMNTSKSGKTAAQPTPSLDLDHQNKWEKIGRSPVHVPKQSIVTI